MSTPPPDLIAIQTQLASVPDPLALLAGLFAFAPVAFQVYKADGHCLLVNQAFRELFGSEPPPEYNVLHDEIAARTGVLDLIHRAFAGETVQLPPTWYDPRELSQVTVTEGRRVAIDTTFFPLRDARGAVSHVAVIFRDRTELEIERERLLASEARARRLLDSGVIGVAFFARDGRLTDANDAYLAMVGYSREELRAGLLRWREMTPPEFAPLDALAFREMEARGYCRPYEKENLHKDGHRIPILLGAALWEGSSSEGVAWILDISERKQAERRRDDEARINDTLRRIGTALAGGLDLDVIVQRVTDEATALCRAQFGAFFYNVTDASGESYALYTLSGAPREAFARFPMPRNTAVFAPTFAGMAVVRSDDITKDPRYGHNPPHHGMPAGHLPVRSYLAVPVVSRSGEVLGGLFFGHGQTGVFTERDERVLLAVAAQAAMAMDNARLYQHAQHERQRAEEANRAKDEFLSVASHELRTPLNAILGWSRMLRSGALAADKRDRALETIERNAKVQVQLVEDILDVSRIITGKLRLSVAPVDPAAVLDAALEVVRPAADARGVALAVQIEPGVGTLVGDAARLQQVAWNLLSNAVKFTPRGGRVSVRLHGEGPSVVLTVADTGRGIDRGFLPYMFEPFRQADASSTRAHGGLGLGLAIVKHLVELHGGRVEADSDGPGRGATFTARFPVAPSRASSSGRAGAAGPDEPGDAVAARGAQVLLVTPPELRALRVLVVDDEPDARELVGAILSQCGARVSTAGSVAEAIERFEREVPDVVVSDVGMPVEDGYALARWIRARAPTAGGHVPAIALTAYTRAEDRTRALAEGFSNHVSKPVEPQELVVVVAAASRGHARTG